MVVWWYTPFFEEFLRWQILPVSLIYMDSSFNLLDVGIVDVDIIILIYGNN